MSFLIFVYFSCLLLCAIYGLQIEAPILFLAGQLDEMVPPAHMHQLFEAAEETSSAKHTFVEFPDGMHMDTWMQGGERYWRSIEIYLQNNAASSRSSSQRSD